MARSNQFKYPPCPACKAVSYKGLTTTRLGNLKCMSCNAMFILKFDRFQNIKVGKSMDEKGV